MLWQYRTIIFEFAKDGLLGEKYINDEEMENTLNEQGLMGWEVVSVVMVQEGVLAVLKRPVSQAAEQPDRNAEARAEQEAGHPEAAERRPRNHEQEHLTALVEDEQPQPVAKPAKASINYVDEIKIS